MQFPDEIIIILFNSLCSRIIENLKIIIDRQKNTLQRSVFHKSIRYINFPTKWIVASFDLFIYRRDYGGEEGRNPGLAYLRRLVHAYALPIIQ